MKTIYQNGITLGRTNLQDWKELRSWLDSAADATSIAYRIEGLDAQGVFPRVLTAVPVETSDGPGWAYGHCINIDDSLLIAERRFVDDDCPKVHAILRQAA